MKNKNKYDWVIGQPPPPIDAHSQVKHQLVFDYVRQYIPILMSNANMPALTLTLVDGFCGGGLFSTANDIVPGSPLLLLKAVTEAESALNIGRKNPRVVKAQYHFVDVERSIIDYLKNVLAAENYGARIGSDIALHEGRFDRLCDRIVADIQGRKGGERAIFLLDQYAYDDVPLPLVNSIFERVQGAEVILTFNVDSLMSFLTDSPQCRRKMNELGLEQYINWNGYEALRKNSQWRPIIQQQLSNAIWKASGARFMTLFFVRPLGNTAWSYWLVHLSNKFRARDVMMALHWDRGNSFGHSLDPGLFKIGYEADSDEDVTGQTGFEMGEAHSFDAILQERCVATLAEELPKLIYASKDGVVFGDLMQEMANRTTATAQLVKSSLDLSVKTGDLIVRREDGATRIKGSSIQDSDIILASPQRSLFFLAAAPKSTT